MAQSPSTRLVQRALLIDADDTLWENNVFFLHCTAQFTDWLVTLGVARESVAPAFAACERESVQRLGYSPESYLEALAMTCDHLLRTHGLTPDDGLLAQARAFGQPVMSPPMILLPGVRSTLLALYPSSQLVLVTKGSERFQREKLARSGLGPLFDQKYVVAEKDEAVYRHIVDELRLDPLCTWMVGNSPRSDINPAVRAGLHALFIPHGKTWVAEHEELEQPDAVVTLAGFSDLLPYLNIEADAYHD